MQVDKDEQHASVQRCFSNKFNIALTQQKSCIKRIFKSYQINACSLTTHIGIDPLQSSHYKATNNQHNENNACLWKKTKTSLPLSSSNLDHKSIYQFLQMYNIIFYFDRIESKYKKNETSNEKVSLHCLRCLLHFRCDEARQTTRARRRHW